MRLSLGVGFAIAIGVAALSEPLIRLLYKPEMAAAAPVLRWLIFCAVLVTLDQILSSTMMAAKAQAHDLGALALSVAVLVLGMLVLVPRQGATGAAMAVALAIVCRVGYRVRWVTRLLELKHLARDLGRVLLAAGVGVAVLAVALPVGSLAALVAALSAYLGVLIVTGALQLSDVAGARQRLRTVFGR